MLKKMAFAAGVSMAIVSVQANALGLGHLQIESPLSQPLRARIPIIDVSRGKVGRIKVTVPDVSVYRQAGIPRTPLLDQLDIKVVMSGGKPYVLLTTQQPVSDPALDFLLLVRDGGGASIREFTGFLSPSGYSIDSADTAPTSESTASRDSASTPDQGMDSTPADVMPAKADTGTERDIGTTERPTRRESPRGDAGIRPTAKAKPADTHRASATYGPVRPNQTLWSIAKNHRPADHRINIDQVIAGIYRKNPNAFGGDINNLFVGSVLTLPSADYYRTIDPRRARRWVIAETQAAKPQNKSQGSAQEPAHSGKLELTAADGSSTASTPGHDRQMAGADTASPAVDTTTGDEGMRTVRLSDAALVNLLALAGSASSNAFKIVPLPPKHTVASNSTTNANANANVVAGTSSNQKTTSAVAGDNAKRMANPATVAGTMAASTSNVTSAEKDASGGVTASSSKSDQSEPSTMDASATSDANMKTDKEANKPQPVATKPKKADTLSMEQLREAGLILGLVFLLALLLVRWWVKRQSPPRDNAQEPDKLVRPSTVSAASAGAGSAVLQVTGTEQDEAQTALADADFNIAYGLHEKAIDGLQPALANYPDHRELRLKELEALHGAGDVTRFNERAQAYSDELPIHADNGDWLAIEHMRRNLGQAQDAADPQPVEVTEDVLSPFEQEIDRQTTSTETTSVAETQEPVADEQVPDLSFEPEETLSAAGQEQAESTDHEQTESTGEEEQTPHIVEFDVADFPLEEAASSSNADEDRDPGLSFSPDDEFSQNELPGKHINGVEQTRTDGVRTSYANETEIDFGDPSHLNVDEDQDDAFGLDESMGTKLDLARAYLDMDDHEMASDLLEDVITQGDAAQQQEAQELKQRIA